MALWPAAHERPHLQVGYMAAPTSSCERSNYPLPTESRPYTAPIETFITSMLIVGSLRKCAFSLSPRRPAASAQIASRPIIRTAYSWKG